MNATRGEGVCIVAYGFALSIAHNVETSDRGMRGRGPRETRALWLYAPMFK